MPAFILDHGSPDDAKRFKALSSFAQGYVTAAYFTECNPDNPELDGATFAELDSASLAAMVADCDRFERENESALAAAYALEPGADGFRYGKASIDAERAGNLFWFARNGHGTGFEDDGDAPCLAVLQSAAEAFAETYVYRGGDSTVYAD